jgi:hypothetical protein
MHCHRNSQKRQGIRAACRGIKTRKVARTGFLIRMDRGMGGKVTTAAFGCRQDRAVLPMVDPTGTFKSRTLMATMKTSIHLKRELLNFPRLIIPCREPDWSRPPTRAVRPLPAFQAGRQNDVRSVTKIWPAASNEKYSSDRWRKKLHVQHIPGDRRGVCAAISCGRSGNSILRGYRLSSQSARGQYCAIQSVESSYPEKGCTRHPRDFVLPTRQVQKYLSTTP